MASPQNKSQVPVGTVLEGKFRITREVGRGGMAAVYEAENIALGKRVAVKILAAELITSRIVRERFQREARASAAIRSPYICDVYDSGMFDNRPFLVMELLEGESLYDMMTRVRRIDVATTVQVIVQTAKGLQKAHEVNVIHRDLKPENIFITKTPEGDLLVKLLDFGLAKFYEQTPGPAHPRLTREGALFGTPAYMSPEQAKGQGEVDHRADLWALGCIAYECLTGTTVWNVDQGVAMILAQIAGAPIPKPSKLRPDLPPEFDQWFLRCVERDPERRYQSAKELADGLTAALDPNVRRSAPSWRESPTPSAEEGALIDQLVENSAAALPPVPQAGVPPVAPPAQVAQPSGGGIWRALTLLLAAGALALGAYAVWLYGVHPPPAASAASSATPVPSASALPAPSASTDEQAPMETESYAKLISKAQGLLAQGKNDASLAAFKEAFNDGGSGVARGLLNNAAIALPSTEGKCKATGLGRPRPFDRTSPSSRPTVAVTPAGTVVAWVDNHQEAARRQASATLLDDALRRVSPARLVTPEGSSVRHPQLLGAADKLILLYWEETGSDAGVYVRQLEADGRIAGPQKRISDAKRDDFYPTMARAPDGSLWVAWTEQTEDGRDVLAHHLSADLEPLGGIVRLTAFGIGRDGHGGLASRPAIAIAEGELAVSFTFERDRKRFIYLLQIPVNDPALGTGVTRAGSKGKKRKEDSVVGKLVTVSTVDGKHDDSRVACDRDGCYVVWNDEKGGALAAYVDRKKSQALWNREFSRGGLNPGIATAQTGAMVAYYEGSRVKIARMTRDALEAGSVVGKVGGMQPYPAISAGNRPGQWYISWRDYESGHLEAYVVRAECQ